MSRTRLLKNVCAGILVVRTLLSKIYADELHFRANYEQISQKIN